MHRPQVSEPPASGAVDRPEPRPAPEEARHEPVRSAPVSAPRFFVRLAATHEEPAEAGSSDGQPSLLKRVTAALQRAVRGPEEDKPSEP